MNRVASSEVYRSMVERDATSDFWSEAKAASQKVSVARLKQLHKSEVAESLALTIWEKMTKDQFEKIQSIDCMIMKDEEIKTSDMNDFLQQIVDQSGINVDELRAIHPNPSEATLLLINQILCIFNQNGGDVSDDEKIDKRPKTVPCRLDQLLETARTLGIGVVTPPSSVYVNERARLAMIERQIKGKMKLKSLHEKIDKARGLSSMMVDKPASNKTMDIKKRIRRVMAIREKMRTENNESCNRLVSTQEDTPITPSPPPSQNADTPITPSPPPSQNAKFYFGTEPPKPPGPAVTPEVYAKPLTNATASIGGSTISDNVAVNQNSEFGFRKPAIMKKEFSEQFVAANDSSSGESLTEATHQSVKNDYEETHPIMDQHNCQPDLKSDESIEVIETEISKNMNNRQFTEHTEYNISYTPNDMSPSDECDIQPLAEFTFDANAFSSDIFNGIGNCLNVNIRLENIDGQETKILNIVDDLNNTTQITIDGTIENNKQYEAEPVHSGTFHCQHEPQIDQWEVSYEIQNYGDNDANRNDTRQTMINSYNEAIEHNEAECTHNCTFQGHYEPIYTWEVSYEMKSNADYDKDWRVTSDLNETKQTINAYNEAIKQRGAECVHRSMFPCQNDPMINKWEMSYEINNAFDDNENSLVDDTYEDFTYPYTNSSAYVDNKYRKIDNSCVYPDCEEYNEKTDVSTSSDTVIRKIHLNNLEQNSSPMFAKRNSEKLLENLSCIKESNDDSGINTESPCNEMHRSDQEKLLVISKNELKADSLLGLEDIDSMNDSKPEDFAPRMCERVRQRKVDSPFELYRNPIVMKSFKGGPCRDDSRKFLVEEEDADVFLSAPDLINYNVSNSKHSKPILPTLKDPDDANCSPVSVGSMDLHEMVSSSDVLVLDESEPLLDESCSLLLGDSDKSQKTLSSVSSFCPSYLCSPTRVALQPEKTRKAENKTGRELAFVVLVSVVVGVGSFGYFSNAGQSFFSKFFVPVSAKAVQVVKRAASLFRSTRISKL